MSHVQHANYIPQYGLPFLAYQSAVMHALIVYTVQVVDDYQFLQVSK
jgi:hypothetical protein